MSCWTSVRNTVEDIAGPVIGSVVGTAIGGPVGGIIGAGLGGTADQKIQGQSWGDSLKSGLFSAAGAGVTGLATGAFPETTSSLGLGNNPLASASQALGLSSGASTNAGLTSLADTTAGDSLGALGQAANSAGAFNTAAGSNPFGVSQLDTSGIDNLASNLDGGASGGGASSATTAAAKPWWTANDLGVGGVPGVNKVVDFTGQHPILTMGAGALAMAASQQAAAAKKQQQQAQAAIAQQNAKNNSDNAAWQAMLNQPPLQRSINPNASNFNYSNYGYGPEQLFYDQVNPAYSVPVQIGSSGNNIAKPLAYKKGGAVKVPMSLPVTKGPVKPKLPAQGGGQADKIPANLSADEHVIPADVVAHLGDGSSDEGHAMLEKMIMAARAHKTKAGTKLPPPAKTPTEYMGGQQ